MDDDPERIKLRRWAVEILGPTAPLDTVADVAQLCRAAEALITFILTGQQPRVPSKGENGKEVDPPEPPPTRN